MKTDFTLGELWQIEDAQIEDAIDYYLWHRFGGTNDPQVEIYIKLLKGLYIKFLKELRQKVGDMIRLSEVKDDEDR